MENFIAMSIFKETERKYTRKEYRGKPGKGTIEGKADDFYFLFSSFYFLFSSNIIPSFVTHLLGS